MHRGLFHRWRVPASSRLFVGISLVDAVGLGLVAGAVDPFAGVVARRLGASPEMLTALALAPFLGFLVSAPASRLSYRLRWGPLLGGFRLVTYGLLFTFAWIVDPLVFVAVMLAIRFVDGPSRSLQHSMFKVNLRARGRPALLQWLRVVALLVSVPVAWAVGYGLDQQLGAYRVLFPVAAALAALTALPLFRLPRRRSEQDLSAQSPGLFAEWGVVRRDPRFLWFMLALLVGTFGEKIVMPLTPIYFVDELQLSNRDVGLALGIWGPVLGLLGYLFWGWRLRTDRPLTVLIVVMFVKALRPALWGLAAQVETPLHCVIAGEAIFRFLIAGLDIAMMLAVLEMARPQDLPLYLGIHYWFIGVRGVAGPFVGLALMRAGMPLPSIYFLIAGIVFAGGVSLLAFAFSRSPFGAGTHE